MRRRPAHGPRRARPATDQNPGDALLPAESPDRLARFEERTQWSRAAAAVAFLVAYSVQVIAQPVGISSTATYVVMILAWVSFLVDYTVRFALSRERRRWFVGNLLDLVVIVLPLFLPLRLFRLLFLISVIGKAIGQTVRGRVVLYTAFSAALLVYACSLSILQVERSQPETSIKNFGDALWWSLETVTTVGYGDKAPVTGTGKLIAAALMIGGIGIVSVITASLASWIVQRVALESTADHALAEAHINAIRTDVKHEIDALRSEIHTLTQCLREQRQSASASLRTTDRTATCDPTDSTRRVAHRTPPIRASAGSH